MRMEVLAVGVLVLAIIFVFNRWTNAIEKHEEERLLSKIQEREDRKRREEEARQKEEEEKRRNQEELAVKISLELKQQREASAKARADELAKIREEKAREREEERLRCLARDQELKRRKAKIEEFISDRGARFDAIVERLSTAEGELKTVREQLDKANGRYGELLKEHRAILKEHRALIEGNDVTVTAPEADHSPSFFSALPAADEEEPSPPAGTPISIGSHST